MSMVPERVYSIELENQTVPIHFDQKWIGHLQNAFRQDGPWDMWEVFQLAYQAEEIMKVEDFNELQCLAHLSNITPFPHQVDTAKKVLNEMHGRAILADEVGLGKTIEAGLIIKEYLIRGLAKKS